MWNNDVLDIHVLVLKGFHLLKKKGGGAEYVTPSLEG